MPLLGPLDEACRGVIVKRLEPHVPTTHTERNAWFEPYLDDVDRRMKSHYESMARNLKRGLVFGNAHSVIGLLRSCLDFALNDKTKLGGLFPAVTEAFRFSGGRKLLEHVEAVNEFRNNYIAHPEKALTDKQLTEKHVRTWVATLDLLRL